MAFYTDGFDTSNSTAWVSWNDQWQTTATMTYTTTTNATTADTVWYTWTSDNAYVTATDATWTQWVTVPNATITYGTYPTRSEEEIASERARIQEAADARQRERLEAVRKAKALLASLLDEKQREQLERQRFFEFVSQTGRKMRIKQGYSRNVDELGEDGKRIRTLCAHPGNYELVEEDHMVAQLLALRHQEEAFLRVANVS